MLGLFRARALALTAGAAMTLISASAFAATVTYQVALSGKNEVPATTSAGTGTANITYDTVTKKLTWTVTYTGLTGPATASHFHSPGLATENAGVTVPLTGDLKSPIMGEATLTDALAKDLTDGKMYFNIHTAANPGGEIRGQVVGGK
jgi:hypothetical protein